MKIKKNKFKFKIIVNFKMKISFEVFHTHNPTQTTFYRRCISPLITGTHIVTVVKYFITAVLFEVCSPY